MVSLGQLAQLVDGQLAGPVDLAIVGAASMTDVRANQITFANNKKYLDLAGTCPAAAVLVEYGVECEKPAIQVACVTEAFTKIVQFFHPPIQRQSPGIHPQALIDPSASIGQNVNVWPGVFIGQNVSVANDVTLMPGVSVYENCEIGEGTIIHSGVTIYEKTKIGCRTIVHAGAVIGAHGFGYESSATGHEPGHQLGNVVIGDEVEIGANSTIDRASIGSTTIGDGTKLDNHVQVGHNCQIGKHNLLCAHVGIGGSCTTGDFVVMGGQVGIADHVDIGDQAVLGAKTGVMHPIAAGETVLGAPAQPIKKQMQIWAATIKLPELRKQIKRLESSMQKLVELSSTVSGDDSTTEEKAA